VLEYAQRMGSSFGARDGLFWPPTLDGELSPLGPLVARAQAEGYALDETDKREGTRAVPRLLLQDPHAAGQARPRGKYNYVVNGNMIGGFALVAWPRITGSRA